MKEDYDFCCSHLKQHGALTRANRLFVQATHYSNAGGAVAYRSPKLERETCDKLKKKWMVVGA